MKLHSVSYQQVKDYLLYHLGCLTLKGYPENYIIAGGAVASSILSILDDVEYPYGDIDIFFSREDYFEVIKCLQDDQRCYNFEIVDEALYDIGGSERKLKKLTALSDIGCFKGDFDGHHYTTANPLNFLDVRDFSEFTRLSPEDQEEYLSMFYIFEKCKKRQRVENSYLSQLKIIRENQPVINIIFINRDRANVSSILTQEFDLSCCRVGIFPSKEKLLLTGSFIRFTTDRIIECFHITSNEGLVERFFKYLDRFNLSFYLNSTAIIPYLNLLGLNRDYFMQEFFRMWSSVNFHPLDIFAFRLIENRFTSYRKIRDMETFQKNLDRINAFYDFEFVTPKLLGADPTQEGSDDLVQLQFAISDVGEKKYKVRDMVYKLRPWDVEKSVMVVPTFKFETHEDP